MANGILPPQKELKKELAPERAKCVRCGAGGQRFLRRCPECGKRRLSPVTTAGTLWRLPGRW